METEKINLKIIELLEQIRPYLISDGGDVEFIKYEDGIVYLRMLGACQSCSLLDNTLYDGIETMLVEEIAEVNGVILVP